VWNEFLRLREMQNNDEIRERIDQLIEEGEYPEDL
jgi:hypothetical protein